MFSLQSGFTASAVNKKDNRRKDEIFCNTPVERLTPVTTASSHEGERFVDTILCLIQGDGVDIFILLVSAPERKLQGENLPGSTCDVASWALVNVTFKCVCFPENESVECSTQQTGTERMCYNIFAWGPHDFFLG